MYNKIKKINQDDVIDLKKGAEKNTFIVEINEDNNSKRTLEDIFNKIGRASCRERV